MGDDQHAAFIGRQIVFQPLQRFHIQMVGRLVQQQQIGLLQKKAREAEPRLLTAAERVYPLIILRGVESQTIEHTGNHALPSITIGFFKTMHQTVIVGGEMSEVLFIRVRMCHLVFQLTQTLFHGKNRFIHALKLIPDAFAAGHYVLLGEIADARPANERDFAAVLRVKSGDDAH